MENHANKCVLFSIVTENLIQYLYYILIMLSNKYNYQIIRITHTNGKYL